MTTIEKLNAVIGSNDPLAVQAAQAAITEIETLARALDAACENLSGSLCPPSGRCQRPDLDNDCATCWRRYLLAQAEQERETQ